VQQLYDLAAGISSRSTKLIHGGLRYLERLTTCRRQR
jgi:glycerol-3-phosphate dehydrogenase